RLSPWFVYSLCLQTLYPTPTPLDLALHARARKLGKRLTYLEDWHFQVGLLADLMDLDDLRELLRDDGKERRQLDAMINAYRAGDFQEISAIVLDPESAREHPQRLERLIHARNRTWASVLDGPLKRGKLFVAVGVGHFSGDAGLLTLLRARGHDVRRVVP